MFFREKKYITNNISKNFERKIKEIKNKNIKNSLNDLLRAIKND